MAQTLQDLGRVLRNILALVLAGGRGERLQSLTDSQSKPALPFGGQFRLIDFPLSNCLNSGIRRIGVVTQYRAHSLINHVRCGWGFLRHDLGEFVELWPAQQQTPTNSWYKGTADAVFQNLEIMRTHQPGHVLILAGDHVYKQDYGRLIADHIAHGADVTVSCLEVPCAEASGFGVVETDRNDDIIGFIEKPALPKALADDPLHCLASMGIYVFNADFLAELLQEDARRPGSSHDFGRDILPRLVGRCRLKAHRFSKSCVGASDSGAPYWRDVGTIDAFWEANLDLARVTPALDLYDRRWPIWTCQEQRPPAKFVFDEDGRRGCAINAVVSAGCIVSGACVRRSILFSGVRVRSYAEILDSVVLPGAVIGRHCRVKRVIVGADCALPEGLCIGENDAHDLAHFLRTPSGVTVVTQRMVERMLGKALAQPGSLTAEPFAEACPSPAVQLGNNVALLGQRNRNP